MSNATDARLDAIAATRLFLEGDKAAAVALLNTSDNRIEIASAACHLATTVLQLASEGDTEVCLRILGRLTVAAVKEGG